MSHWVIVLNKYIRALLMFCVKRWVKDERMIACRRSDWLGQFSCDATTNHHYQCGLLGLTDVGVGCSGKDGTINTELVILTCISTSCPVLLPLYLDV